MEFAAILGIISTVANVITKAIPFIEELFAGKTGAEKSAAVMSMAQVAVAGVEGAVLKSNPQWEFLAPLAQNFINDAIKAVNAIQEQQNRPTGGG